MPAQETKFTPHPPTPPSPFPSAPQATFLSLNSLFNPSTGFFSVSLPLHFLPILCHVVVTHKTQSLSNNRQNPDFLWAPVILLVYLTHKSLQKLCKNKAIALAISISLFRLSFIIIEISCHFLLFPTVSEFPSQTRPTSAQIEIPGRTSHPFSYLYIFTAYLFDTILSYVPNNFSITKSNQNTLFCFLGLMFCFVFVYPSLRLVQSVHSKVSFQPSCEFSSSDQGI